MKFATSITFFAVALAATASASTSDSKQQHRGLVRRVRSNNNAIEERDDEHEPHYVNLQKRFGGQATFYNNAVSEGACGGYTSPDDNIVALNIAQYGNPGAVSKWCGQKILISYGGKSEVATIVDCCPSCAYGSLDMSKGLFSSFSNLGAGVFQMSWRPLSGGGGGDDGSSDSGSDSGSGSGQQQKPSPKPQTHKPSPTPKPKTTSSTSTSTSTSTSSSSSSSSSSTSKSSSPTGSSSTTATAPDSNLADLTNVYKGLLDMANAVGGH